MRGRSLWPGLHDDLDRVQRIILVGAPRTLFLDEQALADPDTEVGSRLYAKLAALELEVVLLGAAPPPFWSRVPPTARILVLATPPPDVARPAIGVFGRALAPLPDCYAWYVGEGAAPAWMHPTDGRGPATTDIILALFGTGLVQERAGAAFREAGAGRPIPTSAAYDRDAILDGIGGAVAGVAPTAVRRLAAHREQLQWAPEELIQSAYAAISAACSGNGAIAAAPPPERLGEPNYQFFWQRDAGQVAATLAQLTERAGDERLRADARERLAGYTRFVGVLARSSSVRSEDLAVSRFTLDGEPLREYGNPQLDGPAQTALTLLATGADLERTLAIAGPYLELLASPAALAPTFDLWEFSVGQTFHALNLARRALRAGARAAEQVGDPAAERYAAARDRLSARLANFDDRRREHLLSALECMPPWMELLSKLDAAVIGSVLAVYDVTDDVFNVEDPRIQDTMTALERHFRERWPVNQAWRSTGQEGAGIGRFPEDTNDGLGSTGGNPWTFVTLWAAQFHLRSIQRRLRLGRSDPPGWRARQLAEARGYLAFVLAHVPVDQLSEQIDGRSGRPRGARRLAWAHAELIVTLLLLAEVEGAAGRS